VRVNAVLPGAVDTPMVRDYAELQPDPAAALRRFAHQHPMRRLCQPAEVAAAVLFLASAPASFVTGAALPVDGGLLACLSAGPLPADAVV
jgi:NAD(P)-dependent dehydrogenase (short-subunit alcohol dehydrogenase family)